MTTEYAMTPEEAQKRHVEKRHERNTGIACDYTTCRAYACEAARRNIGMGIKKCPTCKGLGIVVEP